MIVIIKTNSLVITDTMTEKPNALNVNVWIHTMFVNLQVTLNAQELDAIGQWWTDSDPSHISVTDHIMMSLTPVLEAVYLN
jgi:hypothetical protein